MAKSIGQLCREARERRGLSQEQVAAMTHFARRTISNFERDERTAEQFAYACRLARALDDMELLRQVIEIEVGVPAAGRPIPDGIDRHAAALRDLAIREKREAMGALESLCFWRLGPDQREAAERAARELLDAITATQWVYDALCAAAGIDPDELMRTHRLSAAA